MTARRHAVLDMTMHKSLYFSILLTIMSTALGASIVIPLLPVYASGMGATGIELGLIFSSFALARSIVLPLVGKLADSWGRKGFMLWGLLVYTLIAIGFDLSESVNQLIICRLIQGTAAAMVIPVARSYVGDLTPAGHEGRTMGHFNMAFFGGLALGPWLGGALKDFAGISSTFYAMATLAFFGFILSLIFLPGKEAPTQDVNREQISYIAMLRNPALAALFVFRCGSIIGTGMNWTFLPLYGHEVMSLSSFKIGVLISMTVIMTTLMQPFFGKMADRVSRPGMTVVGGIMASLCLLCVPLCGNFYQLLIVNFTIGVAFGIYMPPLMAMAVDVGRDTGFMTKVMSLLEMAFSIGMVIGPILAGLIKGIFGLRAIFFFGGAIGIATCLSFLFVFSRLGRQKKRVTGE